MAECIKCRSFQFCPWATPPDIICSSFKPRTQTNADRIRSMTDDELLFFLWWFADGSGKTKDQWLDWLKQEAKE